MLKRAFDLIVSATALLLLAPVLAALALAVRLDSPGPALFRQVRVGRHGVPFRIHKFRTMVVDAPKLGAAVTGAGDARITRVGRWLRGRRLDELPQLIDVLQGSMSLVGPRPEVPAFVEHYPPELKTIVLSVRPGLTDATSLAHLDEADMLRDAEDPAAAYIERVLPAKLRMQAEDVRNGGFGSDLRVLLRTAARLLGRQERAT